MIEAHADRAPVPRDASATGSSSAARRAPGFSMNMLPRPRGFPCHAGKHVMGGGGHHDIHPRVSGRGAIIGDCFAAGHARGERSRPLRHGIATNHQARARQRRGPLPADRSTADDRHPHALPVLTHFRCAGVTQIETSHYPG